MLYLGRFIDHEERACAFVVSASYPKVLTNARLVCRLPGTDYGRAVNIQAYETTLEIGLG